MAAYKPVKIISDNPERKNIAFGFDAYAKTIAEVIVSKNNNTPLVIGIYGSWGTGKTTLMEKIRDLLADNELIENQKFRKCKSVWFQAWKYNNEDEILAALIEEIFKTMAKGNFFEKAKADVEKLTKSLNKSKIFTKFIEAFTTVDISDIFQEMEYKKKLGFYESFQKFFDDLIWTFLRWDPKLEKFDEPDDKKGALVVFIDDLDRCPESRIVKVLETIKLFMDKHGCIFVIGADIDIIEKALKVDYGVDARKFMDKIVQVAFSLPQIPEEDFESFIKTIYPKLLKRIKPHLSFIISAIRNNPRSFKRFINDLALLERLHKNKKTGVDEVSLLYWEIIDYEYPKLVEEAKENNDIFNILIDIIKDISVKDPTTGAWEIPADKIDAIPQKSLQPFLKEKRLVDFIRNIKITAKQVKQLISLSSVIDTKESVLEEEKAISRKDVERGIKYKLDEMVKIPAGEFLYGDEKIKEKIDKDFWIDVYPITYSRYKEFVLADGYKNKDFWSDKGWKWKNENNVFEPRLWTDEQWNQPDYPVIGVSWYEAASFCKWLTASKTDDFTYKLPTEKEWERAARGIDGNVYPWGDKFDKDKCNSKESGIGQTSRVTRFPNGISPDGCYDMAGNVWEWTASNYDKDTYVLRGGSWSDRGEICRCAYRLRGFPYDWYDTFGFRCARTVTL